MDLLRRRARRSAPALARADELARAGHWLEAIAIVSNEIRTHGDPVLEARLVQLRHRAFAELDRVPDSRDAAPVADPFPEVGDVPPELPAGALDADTLRGAIRHHGCMVVRGLLPTTTVENLRDDIDNAFSARDGYESDADDGPWYAPFRDEGIEPGILEFDRAVAKVQAGVLAADSPRALFDVLDAYRNVGVLQLIAEYLGEHPTLSARKTVLRRVHSSQFFDALDGRGVDSGWHQDGAFLGSGVPTVNLWVSLSECGRDAPSLDLVARRVDRILPTGTTGAAFEWAASSAVVDEVGAGAIVRPEFAPGDAIFFDSLLVHQTGAAPTMTQVRYAIESWFFAPSTYPLEWIPLVS